MNIRTAHRDELPLLQDLEVVGFTELPTDALTPGLLTILDAETAFGLDPAERVFLRRAVAGQ